MGGSSTLTAGLKIVYNIVLPCITIISFNIYEVHRRPARLTDQHMTSVPIMRCLADCQTRKGISKTSIPKCLISQSLHQYVHIDLGGFKN